MSSKFIPVMITRKEEVFWYRNEGWDWVHSRSIRFYSLAIIVNFINYLLRAAFKCFIVSLILTHYVLLPSSLSVAAMTVLIAYTKPILSFNCCSVLVWSLHKWTSAILRKNKATLLFDAIPQTDWYKRTM